MGSQKEKLIPGTTNDGFSYKLQAASCKRLWTRFRHSVKIRSRKKVQGPPQKRIKTNIATTITIHAIKFPNCSMPLPRI